MAAKKKSRAGQKRSHKNKSFKHQKKPAQAKEQSPPDNTEKSHADSSDETQKENNLETGLYLVSTPIGNLGDITRRGLEVLEQVDLVAAEDTRTAQKLLRCYELHRPLVSLYRDNEAKRIPQILQELREGKRIALISEAGTPGISDPGFLLVRSVIEEGFLVIPVPGASALTASVICSGLPCDRFTFLGFLPNRSGKRKAALQPYLRIPTTIVLYESPHRVIDLLTDLKEVFGDRQACIARELTKRYEEFLRGSISELQTLLKEREAMKGEFVVMVAGQGDEHGTSSPSSIQLPESQQAFLFYAKGLLDAGSRPSQAAKQLTKTFPSLARKEAYQLVMQLQDDPSSLDESEESL